MAEAAPPAKLIVIGSSAGGIDALTRLVGKLPAPFPAPIVIAQHLDPGHESHLAEILERPSALPVRTVIDHARLEPGVIYVVPANRDVEITDHELRLISESQRRPKPSVDLLLGSAAQAFGEDLIAVILTGTGSDGADGARVVKAHGGVVIIQNPQTASHAQMPLSLAPTTVDVVADVDAIGPLLFSMVTGAYTPPDPQQDQQMRALLEQLREQSGIDFAQYRESTIQRRLQRRMLDAGTQGLDEYLHYLNGHPEEYKRLTSAFLIKVTDFFRDPELFTNIRDAVLPELVAHARASDNMLRLWSAGCATGEEAYSLAILVAEALGDELPRFRVRIFATDIDPDAVAFARRGIYPSSALRSLPPELVDRYFISTDESYEVRRSIRELVLFGEHDLGQRPPFPHIDLVLCRNVLIYFTQELQRRALELFAYALRMGGSLILGKAESAGVLAENFGLVDPQLRIYRRQGDPIVIPAPSIPPGQRGQAETSPAQAGERRRVLPTGPAERNAQQLLVAAQVAQRALLALPAGVVVFDDHYDILNINTAARRLLGIHASAMGEDLVHLARTLSAEALRGLFDAGLRGETRTTRIAARAPTALPSEVRSLDLSCMPLAVEPEESERHRAVLMINDVTEILQAQERLSEAARLARADTEQLSETLTRTRDAMRGLEDANEQLSHENALLRSQNQELVIASEESQATSEEVETLNEELQSANEELQAVNEELQATLEELSATNEDLQSRTAELQARTQQEAEGGVRPDEPEPPG